MDPATHLLASYTLARAARARFASTDMTVFVLAGAAPDVDWFWHLPEPLAALRAYGTATHSLVGAGALALVIAAATWAIARKRPGVAPLPRLMAAGMVSTGVHLLLDLCSTTGIELYWPFRMDRLSWNVISNFDAILLAILALCAVLPVLFGLISEEIGAQQGARPPRGWPITAVALALCYFAARTTLHQRAEMLLGNAEYNGKSAIHWSAFADGSSPFTWRGVVETDAFLAEVEVPVGTGGRFLPESAALKFKPEAAPALDAAAASPLARAYTALARFPLITLETTGEGTRAELTELGNSPVRTGSGAWRAVIDLDAQGKVTRQELNYSALRSR